MQKEIQKKREEDFNELKKQVEQEAKDHEKQMDSLRAKHTQLVNELQDQLDQFKKGKNALGICFSILFLSLHSLIFYRRLNYKN